MAFVFMIPVIAMQTAIAQRGIRVSVVSAFLTTNLHPAKPKLTAKIITNASADIASLAMAVKTTTSVMNLKPALAAFAPQFAVQMKIARLVVIVLEAIALRGVEIVLSALLARIAPMGSVSLAAQRTLIVTGPHPALLAAYALRHVVLMPTAKMVKYVPTDSVSLGVE